MNLAASWATESASANISIFMKTSPSGLTIHDRVLPASDGGDFGIDFAWAPVVGPVFNHGRARLQQGMDVSPCLFDIVLSSKQGGVSRHRVSQDAFISIHLIRARLPAYYHLDRLADRILTRRDSVHAEGQRDLGADPKSEIVRRQIVLLIHRRGLTKPDDDFCARHGETFSRPNVERNTFPAPGINLQLECRKGFHLRVARDALLVAVAAELPANKVLAFQRGNRFEDFDLFIADRFAVGSGRRLHGQVSQNLK